MREREREIRMRAIYSSKLNSTQTTLSLSYFLPFSAIGSKAFVRWIFYCLNRTAAEVLSISAVCFSIFSAFNYVVFHSTHFSMMEFFSSFRFSSTFLNHLSFPPSLLLFFVQILYLSFKLSLSLFFPPLSTFSLRGFSSTTFKSFASYVLHSFISQSSECDHSLWSSIKCCFLHTFSFSMAFFLRYIFLCYFFSSLFLSFLFVLCLLVLILLSVDIHSSQEM